MNKKGQGIIIGVLLVAVVALVYLNYLGGTEKAKEFQDKLDKLQCPEVQTNITCDFGILLYNDEKGCPQAKCKAETEQETLGEDVLQVFFIDVGQGDGIYIETPNEKHIVLDAGTGTYMQDFLAMRGIQRIDWLIESHPDADHIGGFDELLETFVVKNYAEANVSCDTKICENVEILKGEEEALISHSVETGFEFSGLDIQMKVLNPNADIDFADRNDMSIVIKLTIGDVDFLLTGDCEEDCEEMMLLLDRDVEADILKVGHHGSASSTSAPFLAAVNPSYAILSYGDPNRYNHPSKEVVDRLVSNNIQIVRTASAGNIEVRTDGTRVEWYCELKEDCFQ